jgi:hypothetical protein
MAHKNHYKKIFVIVAALFILFAPVGVATKIKFVFAQDIQTQTPTINATIPQVPTQNLNVTQAANTPSTAASSATSPTTQGASVGQTQTSDMNLYSCVTNVGTCGIFLVALAVNGVMGVLLSGGAWLVKLGLQFNSTIFNSPGVQTGFSILLAIANLCFVLGIIIIAIATIIRNQTYGIKQLLWKLVFMAILVNFGLVITAPIVGFADSMSNYFISATVSSGANGAYGAYVSGLMSAFNPQTPAETPAAASNNAQIQLCADALADGSFGPPGTNLVTVDCNGLNNTDSQTAFSVAQQELSTDDKFWQQAMGLVLDIALSGIAAFTFICLAILLIIRYLMLGGLLIVLPLAWMTYVFPKFDNSYSKWWNNFIKWTFFPPLALFFIYLAFTTAAITQTTNKTSSAVSYTATAVMGTGNNTDNSVVASLGTQTGLPDNLFVQAGDEILLVGLVIMGLMFALSLSGKAGSTVVNGATTVSKVVGGYVGKKTGKGAARLYQKAGGNDLNAALQRNRIPGFSAIGRGMANLTESATKSQVDAQHKALGLGAMDDDRLKAVTQGLHGKEAQLAALQEWQKRGKVDKIEEIGGVGLAGWLSKNQQTFKDYGQGKLSGDIDTAMGSNDKIRTIAGVMGGARATLNTEEIEKVTNSAQVMDKNGIMGVANETVSAKDLAKIAKNDPAFLAAQAILDNPDSSKTEKKDARIVAKRFQDSANDADAEITDAINKKVDEIDVEDRGNLLGRGAGKSAKAGEFRKLMHTESEKFWEGKDKSDASKVKSSAIFGNKPKFGLDKETLNEIGRSVAHGVVTQVPSAMGSIAGKLDNSKQLKTFTSVYKTSIEEAKRKGQIDEKGAKDLNGALKKVLAGKLAYMGMGGPESAPTPTPHP